MVKISRPVGWRRTLCDLTRSDGKASPVPSDRASGITTMTAPPKALHHPAHAAAEAARDRTPAPDKPPLPIHTRDQARARARQIRAQLAEAGRTISHSAALERVAWAEGYASWNALSARLSNHPEVPLAVGDRVAGAYLSQDVSGTVVAVRTLGAGTAFEVELELDEAVDVVTFASFSNYRRRLRATISAGGVSASKTSDGAPHLIVARVGDPPR